MGILYPMYRTNALRSVAVSAAAAAHLAAGAGRLDAFAGCVDDVPGGAEGGEILPLRASRRRAVARVVVERVAVVGDLLRSVCAHRRRERAVVDAVAGAR